MLRRFVSAAVVLFVIGGVALAAEYQGRLTKIDEGGKKITVKVMKDKDDPGTDRTFTYTRTTTFVSAKKKDLTPEAVSKILENPKVKKGIRVTITTVGDGDAEKVTEVKVRAGKKKKPDAE